MPPAGLLEAVHELRASTTAANSSTQAIAESFEKTLAAVGDESAYAEWKGKLQAQINEGAGTLSERQRESHASLETMTRIIKDRMNRELFLLILVLSIGLGAISTFGILVSRTTAGRLMELVREQNALVKSVQVGKADLSSIVYVTGNDEISQLSNAFTALREAYGNLIYSIRDTGKRLEDMIQEDLRHFGELAAATEEMGTTARAIASTSSTISDAASSTAESSSNGQSLLQNTAAELKEAADRVREGVARMESLANKVREVDQVVQIIRTIASQTNLLALNAAIEASRAGDAGKGFAVVAEEVRKLALQTSKSAENVIGLVQGIQDETQEAVKLIQLIESESTLAATGAKTSQETFGNISEKSSDLAAQIHGIASATEEQRATVESMGRRISELFQNVEHSLKPQLNELVKTVENFRVKRSGF